ncbi:MAG: lipoate--protein ligase family protein [Planctomycetota bacterium]
MRYLDLTLPTPAENLALDEALLEEAERAGRATETLRVWEPREPIVVVGRSSRIETEVRRDACRRRGIPILRRASGGAAIVTGPGCLMYALVLSYRLRPALRAVDHAHRFVLGRLVSALRPLAPEVACRGISDLASGELKFSGNSLRCKRGHLLYHGTLLHEFPLELIGECLAMPPRQPEYRNGRAHGAFVGNLPLPAAALRRALVAAWDAHEPLPDWPRDATARLVAQTYGRREWNEKH